ncbi:hypothetical protein PanNE5_28710 [Pandoraea sp. NE5]|nr:hypothetical protein PanNE5_28710 [Pandoraea sp. NE5]
MAGESGRLEKGALSVRESVAFEFMRNYTGPTGAAGVGADAGLGIAPLPVRGRRA